MVSEIEKIASRHLGKAGNGTLVTPYVTPDCITSDLLVAIPRGLNRTAYNIENNAPGSVGVDVWNAYEVSCLLKNGFPVNFYVRLVYESTSPYIVESKSLKLYLNSFNMHRLNCMNETIASKMIGSIIANDVSNIVGSKCEVGVFPAHANIAPATVSEFPVLENMFDSSSYDFSTINESPDLLADSNLNFLKIKTSLLRSNCRVTNQPDWGDIYIVMKGKSTPTISSLAQYIVSMRKENHFHEEICECVYKRLHDKFKPTDMVVACFYTRRGGIDINPVRFSSIKVAEENLGNFMSPQTIYKTVRQ